ncbi:MAG: VIT1/CCC1 transporter family protein [Firmicutes bacterium]|nr:VIT1/CCC1 transporter family protein [Bacillota bacterium]
MAEHRERHFTGNDAVRDIVIGMSDGLTVPFALAAGLSGAVASTTIIVVAGLAEIAAGSIAMGLGGYLAARTDAEHYAAERAREEREVLEVPEREVDEVKEILSRFAVPEEAAGAVAEALRRRPKEWVDFMMQFELGLAAPEPRRALTSAITIALSYVAGGAIPLAPYVFIPHVTPALRVSVLVTLVALSVFGYIKGRFVGLRPLRSAVQTTVIGGAAATAAFIIARAIS